MVTLFLVCLIWMASGNRPGWAEEQKPLFIMGEENVYPYSFVENGVVKGLDCDLVMEAARRMGVGVIILLVPWKRMMVSVENGFCDAGFAMFFLEKREKFGIYVKPALHYSTYSVFVREGEAFAFESVQDLYGKIVGNVIGYHISKAFDRAVEEGLIVTEEVADADQNILKLASGRIDCLVSNRDMMLVKLRKQGLLQRIVPLSRPVKASKGAYLVFSRRGKSILHKRAFAERFGRVLEGMKRDGTYWKIYESYVREGD